MKRWQAHFEGLPKAVQEGPQVREMKAKIDEASKAERIRQARFSDALTNTNHLLDETAKSLGKEQGQSVLAGDLHLQIEHVQDGLKLAEGLGQDD